MGSAKSVVCDLYIFFHMDNSFLQRTTVSELHKDSSQSSIYTQLLCLDWNRIIKISLRHKG